MSFPRCTNEAATAKAAAAAAAERLGVTTFLLDWDELRTLADDFSQKLRGRRLIYDSETLSHSEASGCEHLGCLINLITCLRNQVESLGKAVSASVWLDYRVTFGFDRLFGHVRGIADVDLPADHVQAAAVIRKKLQIAKDSPDFWCWKAQQCKTCPVEPSAEIIFSSWLEAANKLASCCKHCAVVRGCRPAKSQLRRLDYWIRFGERLLAVVDQEPADGRRHQRRRANVTMSSHKDSSKWKVAQLKLNAVYRMSHASHVLHTGLPDGTSTPAGCMTCLSHMFCANAFPQRKMFHAEKGQGCAAAEPHQASDHETAASSAGDAKPFVPAAVLAVVIGVCSVVPYNMVLRGDPGSPLFISFCLHLAIIGGSLHRAKSLIMERSIPVRYHAAIILLGCSFTSFKSDAYVRLPASVCMMLSNLRMMAGLQDYRFPIAQLVCLEPPIGEVSSLPEEILAVAALGRAYCDSWHRLGQSGHAVSKRSAKQRSA
eukprot:s3229_g6.t1